VCSLKPYEPDSYRPGFALDRPLSKSSFWLKSRFWQRSPEAQEQSRELIFLPE
jgi:hypothetical protein